MVSQVIGWGFALIFAGLYALARLNIHRLRDDLTEARQQPAELPTQPIVLQGMDSVIAEADLAVLRANHLPLSDEEQAAQDAAFNAAVRLFYGGVPYVPGVNDIAAEGEEP